MTNKEDRALARPGKAPATRPSCLPTRGPTPTRMHTKRLPWPRSRVVAGAPRARFPPRSEHRSSPRSDPSADAYTLDLRAAAQRNGRGASGFPRGSNVAVSHSHLDAVAAEPYARRRAYRPTDRRPLQGHCAPPSTDTPAPPRQGQYRRTLATRCRSWRGALPARGQKHPMCSGPRLCSHAGGGWGYVGDGDGVHWLAASWGPGAIVEDADDQRSWSCCAGRKQSWPAVLPEGVAGGLGRQARCGV
jgi:hypothetical protein